MLKGMNLVAGVLLSLVALFLVVVGLMATAGKLPGNPVVGLRLASVRKNKRIWDGAHRVAGPFVALAGVALAFGAAFAFIADGWLWVAPVIAAVVAVVALSAAGSAGARAAQLLDAEPAQSEAPTGPKVDLEALRRAASQADGAQG